MTAPPDPRAIYQQALAEEQASLERARSRHRGVVWARIAVLVVLVAVAAHGCSQAPRQWGATSLVALAFVALSVVIAVVERRIARREARARYLAQGLERLEGRIPDGAPDGKAFADPAHPYASDLDIVGAASLFRLLCGARTGTGQATLAGWLMHAAPVAEIERRQRALVELAAALPFRRDLWLAGGLVRGELHERSLSEWLASPTRPVSLAQRLLAAGLGGAGMLALYAFVEPRWLGVAAVVVLVQRAFAQRHRALITSVTAQASHRAGELAALARLAELVERQRFSDPYLDRLRAAIASEGSTASRQIRRLLRRVAWLESRRNQLFAVPAWALLLPEQLTFAIERWRVHHGAAALRWLTAIGELEALASLATFAFEHPAYAFPEVATAAEGESPRLSADALGHPLLPAATRVSNDVTLDSACRLLVVTGSNMSGKSTLLRTVGVNVALALAGAPVCAARMTLTPLQIGASLRAEDSLERGVSRFFAEIKRLHGILALTANPPPVLFLLDEILNGTNSIDRREGAEAVVRRLLERGAIGLVTTHDLSLAELATAPDVRGANVHFQDTLEGDRLVFDYRIRPGVVTRRNALDLMRLVGIDVGPGRSPSAQ